MARANKTDLLSEAGSASDSSTQGYSAKDIQVLEGLEPVRLRPGMYIGGTDSRALHHLFAEVIDNSMDEAVAGHASRIEVHLDAEGYLSVADNGRGIPTGPHPKFKSKSALEVIMTELHSGGKFASDAYETSGGLHGVGVSVVNALSDHLVAEVARDKTLYRQAFRRGVPEGKLKAVGKVPNRRGTTIRFHPDREIFGKLAFKPAKLFAMARAKAYLQPGVEIRWSTEVDDGKTPREAVFHFPNGLADFLQAQVGDKPTLTGGIVAGKSNTDKGHGRVEWAVTWTPAGFGDDDSFLRSFCNTVPTPDGGTHVQGLRAAITKSLRAHADIANMGKKFANVKPDDVMFGIGAVASVFLRDPQFVGQTKDRLSNPEAAKLVEEAVRDPFDHWLGSNPKRANALLEWAIERADERVRRRKQRDIKRQSATKRLRLPGKLTDCSQKTPDGTELFIVEGDSAGGSAKQARDRKTQAVLPIRGKILNVESASMDKIVKNQEINDLSVALGVGLGRRFSTDDLRYERVIIMTDADVDGAHIAALLITFFYRYMKEMIAEGRLYMAMPPLYKLTQGGKVEYARDEAHRAKLMKTEFAGRGKVDVGRFKGLGEMMASQLKETTMDPASRTLARVTLGDAEASTESLVQTLMGKQADLRYEYIQEHAQFVELDV